MLCDLRPYALILLLLAACGAPAEKPYFTATSGEPCPGYGRSACDEAQRSTVYCTTDDAGVWEFAHYGCFELGVSAP